MVYLLGSLMVKVMQVVVYLILLVWSVVLLSLLLRYCMIHLLTDHQMLHSQYRS